FNDEWAVSSPPGDHKGPPNSTSSTLAPTDGDGLFLRLLLIGRQSSSPLLVVAYRYTRLGFAACRI
ncbi:MAG: hypothetical protein ACXVCM_04655, partial [Ktedonobacteraceae bacterium]